MSSITQTLATLVGRVKGAQTAATRGAPSEEMAVAIRVGAGAQSARMMPVRVGDVADFADGRGVKVKVLSVGRCGTDHAVEHGLGGPPAGEELLVAGHEVLGQVTEVGRNVRNLKVGDLVVPTNMRPADGVHDGRVLENLPDEDVLWFGIAGMHGGLRPSFVEHADGLVKVPPALAKDKIGVLTEPMSVIVKNLDRGYAARAAATGVPGWRPDRALVYGDGMLSLFAALKLKRDGVREVFVVGRKESAQKSQLLEQIGARYVNVGRDPAEAAVKLKQLAGEEKFDLAFNGAPSAELPFQTLSDGLLAKKGVVLLSGTGDNDVVTPVAMSQINDVAVRNENLIVGSVAANNDHMRQAGAMLASVERDNPGWLAQLITPVEGLEAYAQLLQRSELPRGADVVKVAVDVADPSPTPGRFDWLTSQLRGGR